jgi:hypothetical protein
VPVVETYQPEPPAVAEPLSSSLGFSFEETTAGGTESGAFTVVPSAFQAAPPSATPPPRPSRSRFSAKQWALLAVFGVIEIIILIVFAYLVLTNL